MNNSNFNFNSDSNPNSNSNSIKPVIILGAGGHAKVLAEALVQSGHHLLGFMDSNKKPGTSFFQSKILGNDNTLSKYPPGSILLANGVGALPHRTSRWTLADKMRQQGYSFKTIVHPSAFIAEGVVLEEGVQVMAGVIIQTDTHIGQDTIINSGALVDHDCEISERCHLAPRVVCSGGVKVKAGTHLGTGSIVIENRIIGPHSIIAAGSIIYKDIPGHVIFKQKREINLESVK